MLGEGALPPGGLAEDLVPHGSSAAERDRIVARFKAALEETGLGVGMATTNLFTDPAFRDGQVVCPSCFESAKRLGLRESTKEIVLLLGDDEVDRLGVFLLAGLADEHHPVADHVPADLAHRDQLDRLHGLADVGVEAREQRLGPVLDARVSRQRDRRRSSAAATSP